MTVFSKVKSIALALAVTTSPALAATTTYEGTNNANSGNCIPFACPDAYGPHMGFVYQDIAAFTLNVGDIIAFDMAIVNDNELSFDLSLGATTTNGGTTVNGAGFTNVSSLGSGLFGDTILGNYDVAFVVDTVFEFLGGGLIIDFENTNGAVSDTSHSGGGLVAASDSPFTVSRYYSGASVGDMSSSDSHRPSLANFQIITNDAAPAPVPLPAGLPLLVGALGGLTLLRRRKKSA